LENKKTMCLLKKIITLAQTKKLIMAKKNHQETVDIELTDEVAQGVYSNLVMISHSPSEFIMDFIVMMPGMPKGRVRSRIILAPEHAKGLLNALKENIDIFEESFGKISRANENLTLPFGGKMGEA
jgi:hypothetical protein